MKIIVSNTFDKLYEKFAMVASAPGQAKISRAACMAVMPELRKRIHQRGQRPSGGEIGRYRPSYIKRRVKQYRRTTDPKVIISLTRNLENDYSLISVNDRTYGIGFLNPRNVEKANYMIDRYGELWALSQAERDIALIAASEEIKLMFE